MRTIFLLSLLLPSSFSLLNSGEFIAIKDDNDNFIDNLTYNTSIGADNDGNSLQLINGTWYALAPTPGTENILNITNQTPINVNGKDLSITKNLD